MDTHFMDMSRFWNNQVLCPIITCVGIVGNGITIVVLTRRHMRSTTNHYLTALAISDLFYLIFAFTILHLYEQYSSMNSYVYVSYVPYANMLINVCNDTSAWLLVMSLLERYVTVCHPIRGKVFCTQSMAKKVVGAVACTCFLLLIPTAFESIVVEETDEQNHTIFSLEPSAFGKNHTYMQVYYWYFVVILVLPSFLIAVFSSFLIFSICQSKTNLRGNHKDKPHLENRITIMLIAVAIMFLLCNLLSIHWHMSIYSLDDHLVGLIYIYISLIAVSHSSKFILYCAFNDKYRQTFLKTFIPCMFANGLPIHSQSDTNIAFALCKIDSLEAASEGARHPNSAPLATETPASTSASSTSMATAGTPM